MKPPTLWLTLIIFATLILLPGLSTAAVAEAAIPLQKPQEATATTTTTRPMQPGRPWPTPALEMASHLWLERPFALPDNTLTAPFYPFGSDGRGMYLIHHGADIANPMETPILSVAPGSVLYAGTDITRTLGPKPNFYGNAVIVRLDLDYANRPLFILYGHLSRVLVAEGQQVNVGDVIGLVGMTGIALGPHLHLEVRLGENSYEWTQNPDLWLAPLPGQGVLAGRLVDEDGRIWDRAHILLYRTSPSRRLVHETFAYIDFWDIRPDPVFAETFAIPDLPAGEYVLETSINGNYYTKDVQIKAGETTVISWTIPSLFFNRPIYPLPRSHPLRFV